jgi:hypothetical protein
MKPEQESILQRLLTEESHCCELTVEQLRLKKSILLANKPQDLMSVDRELLRLSQKTLQLEKQRQTFMTETGYSQFSLKELIPQLNASQRPTFQKLHTRLGRAVEDSKRLNGETQVLLKLSLHWVNDTLRIISNALVPKGASYTAQGSNNKTVLTGSADLVLPSTINHSA